MQHNFALRVMMLSYLTAIIRIGTWVSLNHYELERGIIEALKYQKINGKIRFLF